MDLPSSAPAGGRAATNRGSQAFGPLDQAPYLHHAGRPWSLALAALGVVFGDIGTSPLYAFQVALTGIGHSPPVAADVLGIVSLVLWALLVMVSLKYVVFVLRADNDGEGGILALLSLVAADQVAKGARLPILVLLGVIGASLLYGDGVITPAISVLSAMEGLKLVAPGFEKFILPATIAVLVGLFVIQRRGTGSIGKLFGPVMVVWFVVIGGLGVINIWTAPAILKAISPAEAARFLIGDPKASFVVIGAVFLALTGGEALYADMGHVGAAAIRRAWFGLVLPALLLNYFGQGALILADPAASDSPFYKLAPGWALIPMVVLATFATIIASQALVSGVFSLTRQAMQMGLSPRARIIPTSADEAGQIYVPAANWLLMVGTLLTVALFRSSENLAAAYGIAVSGTMLITTILLYRVAVSRWQWPPGIAIPVIAVFGAIDATFLVSNSLKIVEGGWFPLIVGAVIAALMLSWRKGLVGSQGSPAADVDAAEAVSRLCRQGGDRPGRGTGGMAHQGRARRLADAAAPYRAQQGAAPDRGAIDLRVRSPASRSLSRAPFAAAARPRLLPDPGPAGVHADPGHSAQPAQLQPARLRRRSRAPELLHRARDHRPPRERIGHGPVFLCDLLVPQSDREPGARFLQDPPRRRHRGGVPGGDLISYAGTASGFGWPGTAASSSRV